MTEKTVTLPLSPSDMVDFFQDKEQHHIIDIESTRQNIGERAMLLYLSNLGVKCSFTAVSPSLMVEYMTMKDFIESPMLASIHANILSYVKYDDIPYPAALEFFDVDAIKELVVNNQELIIQQEMFLDSIMLYILTRREDTEVKPSIVDEGVHDELGFSLLTLLQYEDYMIVHSRQTPPLEAQTYYSKYFDEYMFKGKNLFHYAAGSALFGMTAVLQNEQAV